MNPYESPESPPPNKPRQRINNIWAINRVDVAIALTLFAVALLTGW
jgi:hypothetical protein